MTVDAPYSQRRSRTQAAKELLERPGNGLLALRAFLGVTFTFAGLQKLANPNFFRSSAPGSFDEQLRGSILTSPLHGALDFALHVPVVIAVVISLAELSVGLATLAGLVTRITAVGGMLLSLTFFLTVSFNDSPYYYGADIVFLFAWTPLVLSPPGPLTLDAALVRRSGSGDDDVEAVSRRRLLGSLGAVGVVGGIALITAALTDVIGRQLSSNKSTATASGSTTPTVPTSSAGTSQGSSGTRLALASSIPVGGALAYTDPTQSIPAYVVHPTAEEFKAFSAICTHAGCQVQFSQSREEFLCPCHGSIFKAATGAVVRGPALIPLPELPIKVADGTVYTTD